VEQNSILNLCLNAVVSVEIRFIKQVKHFPVADEIADRLKFGLKKTLKIKIGKKTNDFYLEVKGKQVLFKAGEPYFKKVS